MAKSNSRGTSSRPVRSRSTSRNDSLDGVMSMVRERPVATAAVAASAAAAGLFLWSRRSQISSQLSNLGDQIGEWTENMGKEMNDASGAVFTSRPSSTVPSSKTGRATRGRRRATAKTRREKTGIAAQGVSPGSTTSASPDATTQD